jgi:beta-lactamase class A
MQNRTAYSYWSVRTMSGSIRVSFAGLICLAGAFSSPDGLAAAPPKLPAAIAMIEDAIAKSGADVAVAFETLDGKTRWSRHADEPFHAASTMKVAVLIELYAQVHQGKLRLNDLLTVTNEFHSVIDGSLFSLNPDDDSEKSLYQAFGQTRTLAELSDLMITISSNLATNLLLEKLRVANIQRGVHALGANGMKVVRDLEDAKAFAQGVNNTTTARALAKLMDAIAHGRAVDRESSQRMSALLERQTFNEGIPAGLPPGTRVAHKTGEIININHDAAIVYTPMPFVLVILTRSTLSTTASSALIASITRQLYEATR